MWQVAGAATLSTPPLFNVPYWIMLRGDLDEYLSYLPPATLVALLATLLRGPDKWRVRNISLEPELLRRLKASNIPLAQVAVMVFDHKRSFWTSDNTRDVGQTSSNLTKVV